MSLATSNRDGGKTNEAGHLRIYTKGFKGEVISGLNAVQRAAGANMSVDLQVGDAIIPRSDGSYGHPAWNDAVLNVPITTADGSNPRIDVLVMYIDYGQARDPDVSNNTNGVVKIEVVEGTPAGSPTAPDNTAIGTAIGGSNPFIKLAQILVATGATSIANSAITDIRTMAHARPAIGVIEDFAGATPPAGALLCYGQAISRTDYADLFRVIGTGHGVGDGSTTFNLPDLRGRVVAGKDDMGGSSANRLTSPLDGDQLGNNGGAQSVDATHSHNLSANGWAYITMGTTAGQELSMRRISVTTFSPTHDIDTAGAGGGSGTRSTGAQLGGATDSGGNSSLAVVQPTNIENKIIWY